MDALYRLLKVLDGKTLIFANKKRDENEIVYRVEKYMELFAYQEIWI